MKNYRPIGLTNTLYKLWTTILADLFSQFTEQYQIFSRNQEGFRIRPHKNTIRQLQMAVNIFEDARLHDKDLFTLWIDFSSAFHTVPHLPLYHIMSDLGFPDICINHVKHLYHRATTSITTPYGLTVKINITRGTIQGDSLSPFFFLIFLEPLLRWLDINHRGYQFGCLKPNVRHIHTCSHLAYADDLKCITHTAQDLYHQARKLTLYLNRANMNINPPKCAVSAIHYYLAKHTNCNPLSPKTVTATSNMLQNLTIQNHSIKLISHILNRTRT